MTSREFNMYGLYSKFGETPTSGDILVSGNESEPLRLAYKASKFICQNSRVTSLEAEIA